MINLFAGYKTQIRVLERKLKELDHTKLNPSKVKELTEAIKNLKDLVQEKEQKREERRKAKEEKAKEVEAAPKPEVEDNKVILPKDEFIKEHEHIDELLKPVEEERKEQVEELKEVKEADKITDKVENDPRIAPAIVVPDSVKKHDEIVDKKEKELGPAIISEKEDEAKLNKKIHFKLDQIVKPVRGSESKGRVIRHDSPEDLVYVFWDDGVLKDRDVAGGYYPSDLLAMDEPKKEVVSEEQPKPGEDPKCPCYEDMSAYCPKCKSRKTSDLRTNYDALLKDLKDERQEAYEKSDHVWVTRLDQKIQDIEKAIAEKFGNEKQSAQLEHHDPMGHGLGDLYILPNSPEEANKIKEFLKSKNKDFKWSRADVEGHKWYGKNFIEIPFGMGLEPEIREYFANTPFYAKPVEEIMAKKEAGKVHMHECVRGHAQSCDERLCNNPEQKVPSSKCTQCRSRKQSNFEGKCDLCKGPVCERCKQCHNCVKINGSMGKCAESGTEGLTVTETTPAENSGSDAPEGKDSKDEYSDMWGEPNTRDINSAKGVPGSLFNAETAPAVVEQLKNGIKAPYVNAQVASLGGPENVSVIFTVSADPKESWSNGILENSRYGKFYLHNDGDVEQFSGAFAGWKQPNRAVRSRNVKSVDQLIQVINSHVAQVQATPKQASLKTAIKINVFNKEWEATPVNKQGKLTYEISDGKNKILSISPLNSQSMAKEHLEWAVQREITKNYKKATLKENISFMKKGSKVWVISDDGKKAKIANLEAGVRAYVQSSKIQLEALESQAVSHNGHQDKVLGSTATETLLDCIEGGPIWVNSTELLDANRPPATPEALNPIEEEAAKEEKCPGCGKKAPLSYRKELQRKMCNECYKLTGDRDKWLKEPEDRPYPKQSAKDCPDCHGNFVGKEDEKCPTCGRFSVKEASVDMTQSLECKEGKHNKCRNMICQCPHHFKNKEALKTALPPTIPNQRGYLDNPPVEKEAEYSGYTNYSTWGLALHLDNDQELYNESREMAKNHTSNESLAAELAATYDSLLYEKGEKDKDVNEVNWNEIAQELLDESKENAEYERSQGAGEIIDKLPTMDVEQAKDDLLTQLSKETDPERKKSLEYRYKRLMMASLKKHAGLEPWNKS